MSNPLGTEYLSIPLRNFSVAQMQSAENFVARRTLTKIPVAQQSAQYYVYPNSDRLRVEVQPLGRGAETAGGGWHLSDDNYNAKAYGIHKDNDAQDYAQADAAGILNLDQDATAYVTEQMQMFEDLKFRDLFMPEAGGAWDNELTGTSSLPGASEFLGWDQDGSKPVDDIGNERIALAKRNLGKMPNILYVPPDVLQVLVRHPQIIALYEFTKGGVLSVDMVASALGVDRIEVLWAMTNSGKEGLADDIDLIFQNSVLLAYMAPTGGPKTNTAAAMFTWTGMDGGSSIGTRVDRIPMPWIHSIRIENIAAFDMKIVNQNAATHYLNVLAG